MKAIISCLILSFCGSAFGYYNASDDDLFGISAGGKEIHLSYGSTQKEIIDAFSKYKSLQDKVIYSDDKNLSYGICQYEEDRSIACTNLITGEVHLKYIFKNIKSSSQYFKKATDTYKALYGKSFNASNNGLPAYVCSFGCSVDFAELLIPSQSETEVADDC